MQRRFVVWIVTTIILMIGIPWIAVTFAGDAGMAICFLLFFAINPLYSCYSGIYAGKNIRSYWGIPLIVSGLFLAGTWIFFDMGEPAFLLYSGGYLVIGMTAMLIRHCLGRCKGDRG